MAVNIRGWDFILDQNGSGMIRKLTAGAQIEAQIILAPAETALVVAELNQAPPVAVGPWPQEPAVDEPQMGGGS